MYLTAVGGGSSNPCRLDDRLWGSTRAPHGDWMATGRPGCLACLVQADMLTEPRGRAGVVVGRSLSSALDLGKRGRARAGKERESDGFVLG